jgi:hypothetical protein
MWGCITYNSDWHSSTTWLRNKFYHYASWFTSRLNTTSPPHPPHPFAFFVGSVLFIFLVFSCCPIMCTYVLSSVSWCPSQFTHQNRCSVRLYLKLFVGERMSYLRYLCLFVYSGVHTHIMSCLLFCFSSYCATWDASFSGLSILDCPFGILSCLLM